MINKIHIQSQFGNRACLNDVDFSRDDVFSIEFVDMESAQAFAAKFPKYCKVLVRTCLLYTSPSPRDGLLSRMPSSA